MKEPKYRQLTSEEKAKLLSEIETKPATHWVFAVERQSDNCLCSKCAKHLVKWFDVSVCEREDGSPEVYSMTENNWERRFRCLMCDARIATCHPNSSVLEKIRSFLEYQWVEIDIFFLREWHGSPRNVFSLEFWKEVIRGLFWL